jgi:hypothetical protein
MKISTHNVHEIAQAVPLSLFLSTKASDSIIPHYMHIAT